jgi:lipopolysaccharide transport system ATP-binding protein
VPDPIPNALTGGTRVVSATHLSKIYRLYKEPADRLKELLLGRFGRRFSRDFWALNDVSFELMEGARLGVIGPNGSGKSTLLQILAGTLVPTSGQVEVRGRVAALLELGSGFNPEYTGRENIHVNASILGFSREQTEQRFDAIAAFADIGEFLDQPVKTYSSGMVMRLAFAVVANVDADVLLIDEALAVGDIFFTQKCYRHLERLIQRGTSIILVSHDTSAVTQFCEHVLLLHRGRQIYYGATMAGVKTYFALQRSGGIRSVAAPAETSPVLPSVSSGAIAEWPSLTLPSSATISVGSGARCTGVTTCDQKGQPCTLFEIGQTVVFYVEFVVEEPLETPIVGIEILNERNIVVHGKNSLQHEAVVPPHTPAGTILRAKQRMVLSVAPGDYSFNIGLESLPSLDYARAAEMTYPALAGLVRRVVVVTNAGRFSVVASRQGQALRHHGLSDLAGDVAIEVRQPADALEQPGAIPQPQ